MDVLQQDMHACRTTRLQLCQMQPVAMLTLAVRLPYAAAIRFLWNSAGTVSKSDKLSTFNATMKELSRICGVAG